MPTLSKFYGITIKMYFRQSEHDPPHIHAIYGYNAASIDFKTGKVIDGRLPARAMKLVLEWIEVHQEELDIVWRTQKFYKIEPLH